MFSTLVVGLKLFSMKFSVVLNTTLRTILTDYSLPLAVLIMSFFGSFVFRKIKCILFLFYILYFYLFVFILYFIVEPFSYEEGSDLLILSKLRILPVWAIFLALPFGLMLSLLFFMDQNISSALVNSKGIQTTN